MLGDRLTWCIVGDNSQGDAVQGERIGTWLEHGLVERLTIAPLALRPHSLDLLQLLRCLAEDLQRVHLADAIRLLAVGGAGALIEWRGHELALALSIVEADVQRQRRGAWHGCFGVFWFGGRLIALCLAIWRVRLGV